MSPLSRRQALATGLLGLTSLLAPGAALARQATLLDRPDLRLGVQLWSLGELARDDLGPHLFGLEAIGYRYTELAGYLGRTPEQIRAAHDAAGLKCLSAHVPLAPGSAAEPGLLGDVKSLARHMSVLGVATVVAPALPSGDVAIDLGTGEGPARAQKFAQAMTPDLWKRRAAQLNQVGAKMKSVGLKFSFHNHDSEVIPVDGRSGLDILIAETDPSLVSFELDVGWAHFAGLDCAALISRYGARFQRLHLKDYKPKAGDGPMLSTQLGAGVVAWAPILAAALKAGIREFYVEQEPPFDKPRMEALADSYKYLKRLPLP